MSTGPLAKPLRSNVSSARHLYQRLVFLLLAILVYRIGSHIPIPGLKPERLASVFGGHEGILGLVKLFSGGALTRMSIFALGVMPYISASIIIQLMTTVLPSFEQLKKEGQSGRRTLTRYTRYLTLLLATFQGFGMARYLSASDAVIAAGPLFYIVSTFSFVTGTLFLMWLGEQITERGLGNGTSMIIFASIVSGLPSAISGTLENVRSGQMNPVALVLLLACMLIVIGLVVFVERAQRKITVHYAQRQVGRKVYAAQKSHLPLKINMAGVIPPIFASSIVLFPATLSQWFGANSDIEWLQSLARVLAPGQPLYIGLFAAAIVFFAFFYTALVFNPAETADHLKKSGAFIPGVRPGEQTAHFIDKVMTRLTFIGAGYITLVSILPEFLVSGFGVPFYFGGTSLLIIVVVVMDFVAQVQTHLISGQYEHLLKRANFKKT